MKKHIVVVMVICTSTLFAQNNTRSGLLPALNINKTFENNWRLNTKIESRQQLFTREWDYQHILTDIGTVVAKKVTATQTVGAGYLIRFRAGGEVNHRFIQQYSWVQPLTSLRLGHRLVTDQTIAPDATEFRLRYRINTEIPLNGQDVDINEWYLKINNEYLQSLDQGAYDLEIRFAPYAGYIINKTNRIEVGLDYRMDSFLNASTRFRYWGSVNWFISL